MIAKTPWQLIVGQLGQLLQGVGPTSQSAPSHKVCSCCKQDLPMEEFYVRKNRGVDSRFSRCKSCQMDYNRMRAQQRREAGIA